MREINYSDYFWQDDKVRLRALREEDWEDHYYNRFDSPARRLLECAVELPPTNAEAKKFTEAFSDFSLDRGRIMFTIENMDGENVGGVNLNSIDDGMVRLALGFKLTGIIAEKDTGREPFEFCSNMPFSSAGLTNLMIMFSKEMNLLQP